MWLAFVSNSFGALVVFLFVSFLLPVDIDAADTADLLDVSTPVAVVYLALALPLGYVWGRRKAAPVDRWLCEDRAPDVAEREYALGQPWRLIQISAVLWTVAAVLFGALQLRESVQLALIVGISVLLGGVTTCALGYLAGERILRPLLARVLAAGPPPRPVTPGVRARLMMAWTLATGVPLVGILVVAVSALTGTEADPEWVTPASGVFLSVVALSAGLFAIHLAARSIADPVAAVREGLARVERGDFDLRLRVDDASEIGLLEAGFNRMATGLRERERMRDVFGRQVGRDVARAALDREVELGGEVREVAVIYVDLVGSTALATQRAPTEVVAVLNAFFGVVVEAVEAHGGWVNKFEGDASLCVFGAPIARPDASGDALRAARAMRDRLARELPEVKAGIGVSAGPAVAGNVGAEQRYEYTVIGDPVNEAARLSELAKGRPEGLLASEAALTRADRDEASRWRLGDAVVLRGREADTRLATA